MGGFIQLGPWYGRNITVLRRALDTPAKRKRGVFSVYMAAPVTSPVLEVAIDPFSLYVLGLRKQGAKSWWEFEPTGDLPRLAPSQPIAGGPANYDGLGLNAAIGQSVVITPTRLLTELAYFDGAYVDEAMKRKLLLLIFLVSEALRFDSVKAACYAYVSNAAIYFTAPDFYDQNRSALAGHRFEFTQALADRVRSWRKSSTPGGYDIGLPCLIDAHA